MLWCIIYFISGRDKNENIQRLVQQPKYTFTQERKKYRNVLHKKGKTILYIFNLYCYCLHAMIQCDPKQYLSTYNEIFLMTDNFLAKSFCLGLEEAMLKSV